jgi:hypothetical protein
MATGVHFFLLDEIANGKGAYRLPEAMTQFCGYLSENADKSADFSVIGLVMPNGDIIDDTGLPLEADTPCVDMLERLLREPTGRRWREATLLASDAAMDNLGIGTSALDSRVNKSGLRRAFMRAWRKAAKDRIVTMLGGQISSKPLPEERVVAGMRAMQMWLTVNNQWNAWPFAEPGAPGVWHAFDIRSSSRGERMDGSPLFIAEITT